MTLQIAAYGRLGQDPTQRTSANGKPWCTASIATSIQVGRDTEPETLWLGVLAFGKLAEDLSRHAQGETVAVSGRLQLNRWTTQAGEQQEQMQIIGESLVSARTVRPKGGRKRTGQGDGHSTPREHAAADRFQAPTDEGSHGGFDDDISF